MCGVKLNKLEKITQIKLYSYITLPLHHEKDNRVHYQEFMLSLSDKENIMRKKDNQIYDVSAELAREFAPFGRQVIITVREYFACGTVTPAAAAHMQEHRLATQWEVLDGLALGEPV